MLCLEKFFVNGTLDFPEVSFMKVKNQDILHTVGNFSNFGESDRIVSTYKNPLQQLGPRAIT